MTVGNMDTSGLAATGSAARSPENGVILLLQLACSRATYETPELLLDSPEVVYQGAGHEGDALEVTGGVEEWRVVAADAAWTLRSPAEPDLGPLDGVAATVVVGGYEFEQSSTPVIGEAASYRSLVIASGTSVEYEAAAREPSSEYPSAFGAGFVRYGDALGTMEVEYWLLTVRELVFAADDGDVAIGPSEPTILVVGGNEYLTTVLAAWESDILDESVGQPKCGIIGDRFAYEMVRIPAETVPVLPSGLQGTGDIEESPCG